MDIEEQTRDILTDRTMIEFVTRLIAMIGEEKDKELAELKEDIDSNRKARLDAEVRATKAASECDRLKQQIADAKEYITSLEEQLGEATKPGRVLSDDEIWSKWRTGDTLATIRDSVIALVRWAITESKPQLCGPSAQTVEDHAHRTILSSNPADQQRFYEWFNAQFKPSAEYEKRIAELERSNDCSLAAMRNAQAACQDEANEKQRLQDEVERLKQQQPLPPNKCLANKLSREQVFKIALEAVCNFELNHRERTIIDAVFNAIYGEQMAEAKEPTPEEMVLAANTALDAAEAVIGDEVDLKPIDAAIQHLKRLLAEKAR